MKELYELQCVFNKYTSPISPCSLSELKNAYLTFQEKLIFSVQTRDKINRLFIKRELNKITEDNFIRDLNTMIEHVKIEINK